METNHYHQDEWQKHYKPLLKRQTMETQQATIIATNYGNKAHGCYKDKQFQQNHWLSKRQMTETQQGTHQRQMMELQ